jgi:hypothetical protein
MDGLIAGRREAIEPEAILLPDPGVSDPEVK